MAPQAGGGLNDSGAEGITRIVEDGAVHFSQTQRTSAHAHHAWKIHIGLDAPVWLESEHGNVPASAGARVVIAPPNTRHATGAVGWSVAVFISPGSRRSPWRASSGAVALSGASAQRVLDACRTFAPDIREETSDFVAELAKLTLPGSANSPEARVRRALDQLKQDPGAELQTLARGVGLSLDRLSHLTSGQTGLPLRRHALWARLLSALSSSRKHPSLAAAAHAAGFADHAHMTRTYRAFLGRTPSEFSAPPDVVAPWR